MQKDLHDPCDRDRSEAESKLVLPAGEFGALLLAGALFSLSALFGPSTLVSAMPSLVTTTVAILSTAIAQMSITLDPRFKAEAAEYRAVLEPFGQTNPAGMRDYHASRRAKCPGYFSNSVRGSSGDRCRTAKRSESGR